MSHRFSKIFYIKVSIFFIFILISIVLSFLVGRSFGYFLMGDLQGDKKFQGAVEQAETNESKYTPLISPRFQYNPDEFPRDEYRNRIVDKPRKDEVVEEGVDVEMNYVGKSSEPKEIFNFSDEDLEETSEQVPTDDEVIEENIIYKVYLGTFTSKENAENIYTKLKNEGYEPYIEAVVKEGETTYRVQIGAFRNIDNANILAEELRKKGYNAWTRLTRV